MRGTITIKTRVRGSFAALVRNTEVQSLRHRSYSPGQVGIQLDVGTSIPARNHLLSLHPMCSVKQGSELCIINR